MVKKKKQSELKSKEELLEIVNSHLVTQQEMAEKLRQKALKYVDKEDGKNKDDKKARNQYIYAYNQQVEAVSKTVSTLIKIQNSSLKNDKEIEEEESDELID